jgi:hypothetical protein
MNAPTLRALALSACTALALAAPAVAQDESEAQFFQAFSGDWFSFEPAMSTAISCKITLLTERDTAGTRTLSTADCIDAVAEAESWTIVEGQIRLLDGPGGAEIAALGGNQFRISGDLKGGDRTLILERANGDTNSQAIRTAIAKYRCIYRGFTDECADTGALRRPEGSPRRIRTLVNLNVRNQPRADAPVIGVVPNDSVLTVDECNVTTDGFWCKARFGENVGWFTRTALRQETWPILTFEPAREG